MKTKFVLFALLFLIPFTGAFSQFDKFSFQISVGIAEPTGQLKGETPFTYVPKWTGYWLNYNSNPPTLDSTILYNILFTDSSFMKENYGVKTGFSFSGSGKINFDKFNTVRGVFTLGFSSFNSFVSDKSGNFPFLVSNQGFSTIPVTYSNTFNNFGLGLGVEVAPTSFTNVFTPYFGGTFNFNFMTATLTRAYGRDSTKAEFGAEFRIGAALFGGLEAKVTKGIDIVAGVRYDFGNLLLKSTRSSISDNIAYGKTNLSLNDGEGFYYSNLSGAEGEGSKVYNTSDKNLNWWTFFIGVNIYPSGLTPTPKKIRLLD